MNNTLRSVSLLLIINFIALPAFAAKDEWRSPETVEGTTTISVSEAKQLFDDGMVFIDVRNSRLYAKGHIPGAHHLDLKTAFDEAAVSALVNKDEPVVIYCSGVMCSRSYRASAKAVSWGYTDVKYFRSGITEWRNVGHAVTDPVEADE